MTHTIRPSDARHLGDTQGDTEGDTQGDSVSPSCIPLPACKLPRKYKALADRSAIRINPDLPLGAPPLGPNPIATPQCRIHFSKIQCSYSHRSSPSWLSARWSWWLRYQAVLRKCRARRRSSACSRRRRLRVAIGIGATAWGLCRSGIQNRQSLWVGSASTRWAIKTRGDLRSQWTSVRIAVHALYHHSLTCTPHVHVSHMRRVEIASAQLGLF